MTPAERHKVAENIKRIPEIIKDQSELATFQFPPPTANPISFLASPQTDGLKCRRCPYIARQAQTIQANCRRCQNCQNSQGRGRPKTGNITSPPDLPWREGVTCQRFFPSKAASGWFEVGRKIAGCRSTQKSTQSILSSQSALPAYLPPETRVHIQEVLEREQKYLNTENQPRVYTKAGQRLIYYYKSMARTFAVASNL